MSGEEKEPELEESKEAFFVRRDKALSIVVLSVHPSLLYLLGEPADPTVVWEELAAQFQRKSWANELSLERRLVRLKQPRDRPLKEHIKEMTELLDEMSLVIEPLTPDRRVTQSDNGDGNR